MADKMKFDDYDYEASDSENEYTEREQSLLKKVRSGKKKTDNEEEVLAFDDDSEPEKFEADSDFDEPAADDDGYMPDIRAWGKKKQAFYGSNLRDEDRRQLSQAQEEIANQEQQEALEIQKRLATELNETDFSLDLFALPSTQEEKTDESIKKTKTDLSDLSKTQKLAAFKAEAPEFDGLMQDFEERFLEAKNFLIPALDLLKTVEFPSQHPFFEFLQTRNELILNYCTNISFYLMLKAKRVKVHNHPLVKRLIQFRQLICQLDDISEYVVKPQLEILLYAHEKDEEIENPKLKMLETIKKRIATAEQEQSEDGDQVVEPLFNQDSSEDEEEDGDGVKMEIDHETGGVKRQITRQIAKNKGLTAIKRRELRNPRVKNKRKFQKAEIRRKGAVRPMRSKVELYSGEATGVKTHLKRSIKIK